MNAKAVDFAYYTVSDIETSVSFYQETLGLELEILDEESGWAEFASPPTTLALGEANPHMPISPGEGGVGLALAVDDVKAAVDELREEEVTVLMDTVDSGVCDMAMVGDPDGNPIMLHRRHDGTHGRKNPFP
ncbi:VOC family protein [Halocatena pleomorpha]|uniref:Glyoxalase/bleomycin resistance/dioxygenase family protein n=1 Tax=Halocatena pleomorpha TaxID=1785090 RepID=A0A3P3RMH4_9EURY|nr:VOC family protein [Halocatena pleomorpha]RRJ34070.1 glyoxalase/bleomycin resistance/dioxygenase family protein [Halocatena pleomorpha]